MDSSSADGVFIPFSPKDPSEHHILLLCTEAVVFGKKLPGSFQTSYLEPTQQYGCHCQGWLKQAHHLYFLCLPILFLFSFVIHASVSESFFSHVSHQTSFLKLCFYLSLVSPPPSIVLERTTLSEVNPTKISCHIYIFMQNIMLS